MLTELGFCQEFPMPPSSALEALVVGAGPTGMIAAIELQRRGINCRIVERRAGPADTSRAITVHARTLEILDDIGIVERWLHGGVRNDGYVFNFRGSDVKPRLDYTRLPTRYPYVLMFNQNESEKFLRDHLEHNLHLPIEWSTELTDIREDDAGTVSVTLTHKTDGDREETIHPQWVVACDGLHSPTREALGIKYDGSEYEGMVMQMVDARLEHFEGSDHLLHYYISENTFLMIGRLEGANHRVLVSAQGDIAEVAKSDLITPIVAADLPGVVIGEPEWKTSWEIWIRKAEQYRKGHVFLCGESGHIHSVAGGQGWNVSMQDAYNLCWKLALVIQGKAGDALLDSYEREREPVSEQVIEGSSLIHEIIMAHGAGLDERMALTQTDGWNDNAVARVSGLSYNYRNVQPSPDGCITDALPAAGDRIADVQLSEHLRFHQLLAHTRFTLLILVNSLDESAINAARAIAGNVRTMYADLIRPELISPSTPHPWPGVLPIEDVEGRTARAFGAAPGGEMLLIRPDGYLACRMPLSRSDALHAFLTDFLDLH
jgi:2-polyprenyl-6-methoxyphenol hydroxylase-like FAD-dependent oxidoreductase